MKKRIMKKIIKEFQKLYDEIENDYGHALEAKYKTTKGTPLHEQYSATANTDLKWIKRIKIIIETL